MEWWTKIRLQVLRGERSKGEVQRREGIHWETLKRILAHSESPGYRMKQARPYLERLVQIIEEGTALPRKRRHTAKRIYERIREMGYEGRYTEVRETVRELKRVKQEAFMGLIHRRGEAEVDSGYGRAKVCEEPRGCGHGEARRILKGVAGRLGMRLRTDIVHRRPNERLGRTILDSKSEYF